MAVKTIESSNKNREKRAQSISAMGLVNREGDLFRVSTPSLRGRQTYYEVRRDDSGKIRCNCLEFEEAIIDDSTFRCEHILAIKFAIIDQNTEPVTKKNKTIKVETEITVSKSKNKNATELRKKSKRNEQKSDEVQVDDLVNGKAESNDRFERNQLANTRGKNNMTQDNLKAMPFFAANKVRKFENSANHDDEKLEDSNNILDFPTKLRALRADLRPDLLKQRHDSQNRKGELRIVDYLEWHTVADILDENTPNWIHSVKDIDQFGNIIIVTVALTIDGITREGIGTGLAESEMAIKKAEHDALKSAAVKFGVARELYKNESNTIEGLDTRQFNVIEDDFHRNPIAKSLYDLVTAKQLGMIRAIAREIRIDANEESNKLMNCRIDELSKQAASDLIQHLQNIRKNQDTGIQQIPMRRAS